jgi:hypothetical protein
MQNSSRNKNRKSAMIKFSICADAILNKGRAPAQTAASAGVV